MNIQYQNALTEVSTILSLASKDVIHKIPHSFLSFIEENRSKKYTVHLDMQLPLVKQNLLPETKSILSLIYRSYLCDVEMLRRLEIEDMIKSYKMNKALDIHQIFHENFKKFLK